MKKMFSFAFVLLLVFAAVSGMKVSAAATGISMHRIYNPVTKEHLHTKDLNEVLVHTTQNGWEDEGTSWITPETSNTPVYRVFNRETGEHFYTTDAYERRYLLDNGPWNDEGIGWYSDDAKGVLVYRLYNPNAGIGAHHYTTDAYERSVLLQNGWSDEGIAWYGMDNGKPLPQDDPKPAHTHTWVTEAATCQKEGKIYCSECGEVHKTIPIADHRWEETSREINMILDMHSFCYICGLDFTRSEYSMDDVRLHDKAHAFAGEGGHRGSGETWVSTGRDLVHCRCSVCGKTKTDDVSSKYAKEGDSYMYHRDTPKGSGYHHVFCALCNEDINDMKIEEMRRHIQEHLMK